ncbi:MAG TPA: FecR domain-containing protein [Steroidobacteraceae bacterium]|nr:FecR domain-containing protein [Steroidobacteraceae bacterium]
MTDRIDENPPMSIPEQAAEWFLRWHCGDLSIAERFEYLQWLKTSPVHIAETMRMCRLYSWLENTKLKLFITNEDNFTNVVELPPRERETVAARGANGLALWKTRIAAGVAAIALAAAANFVVKTTWLDHTLQTQASEWRSVPLSDGSSITVAPFTKLRHDIGDEQRVITLSQGSAMFRVAKDPSRPFLVDAGGIVVTATGTQFSVAREGDEITVTMREGSVIVTPAPGTEATFASVPLEMDQQLTVSTAGEPKVKQVNGERETEYLGGRVTFGEGDTVMTAVKRFNKFNAMQIVVDQATGTRPMRGSFDAIDPMSFAAVVERSTGSAIERESSTLVRIGRREQRSP